MLAARTPIEETGGLTAALTTPSSVDGFLPYKKRVRDQASDTLHGRDALGCARRANLMGVTLLTSDMILCDALRGAAIGRPDAVVRSGPPRDGISG